MNRRAFLVACGLLGTSLTGLLSGCSKGKRPRLRKKIVIIGAGAAGLSTAYFLQKQGIECLIIEATSSIGGRMKIDREFADFPIPLGAEWLHTSPDIFQAIVSKANIHVQVDTVPYKKDVLYQLWDGHTLKKASLGNYNDRKFVDGSWMDFFQQYILPSIQSKVRLNTPVKSVNYAENKVVVRTTNDQSIIADKVIVTAPLQMLQKGLITFYPPLPSYKINALESVKMWDGIKAFFAFDKRFYPTFLEFADTESSKGERLYYDAAYGQKSAQNILGFFSVGAASKPYLRGGQRALKKMWLSELDAIFDGQASRNYIKHIVQDWSQQPYIGGAYLDDYASYTQVAKLSIPVADRVYFAGEAYTDGEDWGSVHAAIQSAADTVEQII